MIFVNYFTKILRIFEIKGFYIKKLMDKQQEAQ